MFYPLMKPDCGLYGCLYQQNMVITDTNKPRFGENSWYFGLDSEDRARWQSREEDPPRLGYLDIVLLCFFLLMTDVAIKSSCKYVTDVWT